MPDTRNLLLIFTRNPELGKVKKRLAADIGDPTALELYQLLLKHTFDVTKNLTCEKIVYYSEHIEKGDIWEESVFQKKVQRGNDLGERMKNAFSDGFDAGYSNIVIIGSDLYDLKEKDLETAFSELQNYDYVVGPAQDGGYYLIGKKSLNSTVFENKTWGSDSVLQDTLKDLKNENITLLEERNDIDTLDDLEAHPDLRQYIKRK